METNEIIENNRLIAEFIGRCGKHNKNLYTFKGIDKVLKDDIWYNLSEAKFHSSWDWLMPVVDKIESLTFYANQTAKVCIKKNYASITIGIELFTEHYNFDTKIECLYHSVIEFIKWYNEKNKDE